MSIFLFFFLCTNVSSYFPFLKLLEIFLFFIFRRHAMELIFTGIKARCGVRMTGFIGSLELVAYYINELLLGA
jgi:hypothetical protein